MKKFKNNLKQILEEKQMTQKEFAEKMGISPSGVSRYVCGNRMPQGKFLIKAAKILGVGVDKLFDFEKEGE